VVDDVVFRTERLTVRPWTHDDVEEMFDIYRRWEVARWLGAAPRVAQSVESMHSTVDRWMDRAQAPYGIWAVVPEGSRAPVGTVLLVPLQNGSGQALAEIEVGWHLHPDAWGHGYATESARGALARGWAAGLDQVHAVLVPGNEPSAAVTRRLGMAPVGRTDRFYGIELDEFVLAAPATGRPGDRPTPAG
jgi:RimJ/RimL family protein N-acetyltransferase